MPISITPNALKLLYKYAKLCCDHIPEQQDNKSLDDALIRFPNAMNHLMALAEEYNLKRITEPLVHAYFFTLHNIKHKNLKHYYHMALLGEVCSSPSYNKNTSPIVNIRYLRNEFNDILPHKVYNPYGINVNKDEKVIIHAGYIVTNNIPPYLLKRHDEEDLCAWESIIRGRQFSIKSG